MSFGFKTELDTRFTTRTSWGRAVRVLLAPLEYQSRRYGKFLTVPRHFSTDFASVPCFCRCIFPPDGRWAPAAVLHDWLYRDTDVTRRAADSIFLEAMELSGVGWRRWLIWLAVRLFGWAARRGKK